MNNNYTVTLRHWVDGSGFTHSEEFDELDRYCTAQEYIDSLDEPLVPVHEDNILVVISDSNGREIDEAWVVEVE